MLNKNYGQLLEDCLNNRSEDHWKVINLGLSRALTSDVLRMKDLIARENSDYIIINLGAVDAPSREIPLWYADVIFERNGKYLKPYFDILYRILKRRHIRRLLVYIRFRRSWTQYEKFKKQFEEILDFLLKDTSAKIIILGINQGNERIEELLPGTVKKYYEYNEILRKVTKNYNLDFIDFSDLNSELHFPDGVHYNIEGHHKVCERILPFIR